MVTADKIIVAAEYGVNSAVHIFFSFLFVVYKTNYIKSLGIC